MKRLFVPNELSSLCTKPLGLFLPFKGKQVGQIIIVNETWPSVAVGTTT